MIRYTDTRATAIALTVVVLFNWGPDAMAQTYPKVIPTPGGAIAITGSADQSAYDDWKYAPARRAGDYVYVSGVVIRSPAEGEKTAETFKAQTRLAFERLRDRLKALNADLADVVMINSFHDWSAAEFGGDRMAQFKAFNEVKQEFMPTLHPAWTAVGTSGLIRTDGVAEVQMIAYAPKRR